MADACGGGAEMMVTFEGTMLALGIAGGFGVSFAAAFGEAVLADW